MAIILLLFLIINIDVQSFEVHTILRYLDVFLMKIQLSVTTAQYFFWFDIIIFLNIMYWYLPLHLFPAAV